MSATPLLISITLLISIALLFGPRIKAWAKYKIWKHHIKEAKENLEFWIHPSLEHSFWRQRKDYLKRNCPDRKRATQEGFL